MRHSHLRHAVKKGDRVAQLILEQIVTPEVEEVAVRAVGDDDRCG